MAFSTMKLYGTATSPYARLTRIVMLEKGLEKQVELVWTKTRVPDDPILAVHPSGRVPVLILEDGTVLEDTPVIVDYLDSLVPPARFAHSADRRDWHYRGIEATARAMIDGLAVWAREVIRPAQEQSSTVIGHEQRRAFRLADHFESRTADPSLNGPLTMAQIYLFGALDIERRLPAFNWRDNRPNLVAWHARIAALPSVAASAAPR
jgi:glutathione S-transferase